MYWVLLVFSLLALPLDLVAQVVAIPGGQAPLVNPQLTAVEATALNRFVTGIEQEKVRTNVADALSFASASGNADAIAKAWTQRQNAPDLFEMAIEKYKYSQSSSSDVLAIQTVFYAALAADSVRLKELADAMGDDGPRIRQDIGSIYREVISILRARSGTDVMVYATGDVRTATANESDDFRSGTGSLGVLYTNAVRRQLLASITVASTETNITTGYGSAILAPSRGQALRSGVLSIYQPDSTSPMRPRHPVTGWRAFYGIPWNLLVLPIDFARGINYAYGTVSVERWQYVRAPADTQNTSATALGVGLLRREELGCCRILTNEIATYADFGFAVRWLSGDISARDSVRRALLQTRTPLFLGPETGIQIQFGRVIGSLQLYYLFASTTKGGAIHVDGLTRLQAVAAFTVTGEIFRGPISIR